jgi:hypothetical protein
VQTYQRSGGFQRTWLVAKIFGGNLFEAKFLRRAAFPQKFHLDIGCECFRLGKKFGHDRLGKVQHYVAGFDFAAFAGQTFYLQRAGIVGHDAANLETAVFFVKDIHGGARKKLVQIITAQVFCRRHAQVSWRLFLFKHPLNDGFNAFVANGRRCGWHGHIAERTGAAAAYFCHKFASGRLVIPVFRGDIKDGWADGCF